MLFACGMQNSNLRSFLAYVNHADFSVLIKYTQGLRNNTFIKMFLSVTLQMKAKI